jgi:hypothetical protein
MRLTDFSERAITRARWAMDELLALPSLLGQVLGHTGEPLYLFQTRHLEVFRNSAKPTICKPRRVPLGFAASDQCGYQRP